MTLLDAALRLVATLPPLPQAILELSKVVQQPFPTPEEVTAIIEEDPALAAAVLRVANSAAAGATSEVTSVARAVVQIGPRSAIEVSLCAAFSGYLPRKLPGYDLTRDDFIDHCVKVGRIAASICAQLDVRTGADPFTCGLIHDCGKLVLCRLLDMKKADIKIVPPSTRWVDAERAILGVDHSILGEALARAWALPAGVGTVARWHHLPWRAPEEHARLCAAVHVADEHLSQPVDGDLVLTPEVMELLGVDELALVDVLAKASAQSERRTAA